jgi:F420-dependent oxidoreductase-like protein
LRAVAQAADASRFHSLWTFDHLIAPGLEEDARCLEGWTLLAALATVTERVQLGCLVSSVTFRSPAVLAKMAATVDEVSGGRLTLGLGAGWHEREHRAYGIPFYTMGERQDRLQEAAELIRALFRGTLPVNYAGRFYTLEQAPFAPWRAVPVMIGGDGEKRTLRTVALYGDVLNISGTSPEAVVHKLKVFERHCAEVGRDPAEVRKTIKVVAALVDTEAELQAFGERFRVNVSDRSVRRHLAVGDARHVIEVLRPYAELGIDEVLLQLLAPDPAVFRRWDEEVLSAF